MSDEESHSESELYCPEEEEQAKTEQNNMTKVTTHGDENFSNSQEELQKFVQETEKWKHCEKNVKWYEVFLPFSWRDKQDKCSDFAVRHGDCRVNPQVWYMKAPLGKNEIGKFLKTAADEASLQRQGSKVTNHSVRKTSIGRLLDANTPETFVAQLSGHKLFKASNHTSQQMSTISDRCRISWVVQISPKMPSR